MSAPGPVWASYQEWVTATYTGEDLRLGRKDFAYEAWNARQPEIDALKAERDEYRQLLRAQGTEALDLANRVVQRLDGENRVLRARLREVEAVAQAVWDAESQSGDAIAAWTRLIDVLEHRAVET